MFGPTQNYDDPGLDRWRPRPVMALVVKVLVYGLPPALAILLGWAAATWVPASRLGMNPWVWLAAEVVVSTALIMLLGRVTKRLLPLSTMLTMALVFPDEAPSRLSLALRTYSPAALRRRVDQAQRRTPATSGEEAYTTELLGLVAALSLHDHATRGHSERVQAYTALLADELKLNPHDAARVRWAALLHDIGKLRIPAEVLNKSGRPTTDEWDVLATHPHAGLELAAPLADFLGDWIDAIGQHHERFDGCGYPLGLRGGQIHYGARIIAVADTYDVITSTRSYKTAMPASQARAELARCAGTQFDPAVVRAFLAIGIGRLRLNAGPLSALTGLPGIRTVALPELGTVTGGLSSALSTAGAATTAALGLLVGAVAAPAASLEPSPGAVATDDASSQDAEAVHGQGAPAADPAAVPPPGSLNPAGDDESAAPDPSAPDGTPEPGSSPSPGTTPSAGSTPRPGTTPSAGSAPKPSTATTPATSTPRASASPTTGAAKDPDPPAGTCDEVQPSERTICDLAGATLVGDWSGLDLKNEDLTGATIVDVDLDHATLEYADLSGATLIRVDLSDAKLMDADLSDVLLRDADLSGADMTGARLAGATITRVTLTGTDMADVNLVGATISSSTLTSVILKGANLTDTTFTLVSLSRADLSKATLRRTDLALATLTDAKLDEADLTDATLRAAAISGIELSKAILVRTTFWLAIGTPETTTDATWSATVCPSGATTSSGCW